MSARPKQSVACLPEYETLVLFLFFFLVFVLGDFLEDFFLFLGGQNHCIFFTHCNHLSAGFTWLEL